VQVTIQLISKIQIWKVHRRNRSRNNYAINILLRIWKSV